MSLEVEMQRLMVEQELRAAQGDAEAARVLRERSLALRNERAALIRAHEEDAAEFKREMLARREREQSVSQGEESLALVELIRAKMQDEQQRHEKVMRELKDKLEELEAQDPVVGAR